ncbi:MAG: SDR family NAD(P)-dependent oxidoreductase [Solirubrobacterales bacterium]
MPTALVTGASSGIGEQFARQLADRGYGLVLLARRKDRLRALADELPTRTEVLAMDLSTEASDVAGAVEKLGLEIDLLVNSAGFGTHGRFLDQQAAVEADEVRVNCEAVVTLTHAFLPGMVERDWGGVITVASTAGQQPLPYEAVYSASKAFARTFHDALHTELRDTGVRVLCVNPGPVPTEWQKVAGFEDGAEKIPGAISAQQCVAESLEAYDRNRRAVVPGAKIRWLMRIADLPTPRSVQLRVTERLYRPD